MWLYFQYNIMSKKSYAKNKCVVQNVLQVVIITQQYVRVKERQKKNWYELAPLIGLSLILMQLHSSSISWHQFPWLLRQCRMKFNWCSTCVIFTLWSDIGAWHLERSTVTKETWGAPVRDCLKSAGWWSLQIFCHVAIFFSLNASNQLYINLRRRHTLSTQKQLFYRSSNNFHYFHYSFSSMFVFNS